MKKLDEYPSFILRNHVIEFVKSQNEDFASQLTDLTQTFSFGDFYYAPAQNGYLLKVHFGYNMGFREFGDKQYREFTKLKLQWQKDRN